MTKTFDLEPSAHTLKTVLASITDDQLRAPTPCEAYSVGDLLDHVMGLSLAFRHAATKSSFPGSSAGPGQPSVDNLDPDWRTTLPRRLDELAEAWATPAAWDGMAKVGGMTMPAEIAGMVAVDELVLHGWDLARSTGQSFESDPASTEACFQFTTISAAPGEEAGREGLFGPVRGVPADAPLLDRALGLSGRDPQWRP